MSSFCENCGTPLRSFVAFRCACKVCGASYHAVRRRSRAISPLAGLHGALFFLYVPFLLWSPFGAWINFGLVPIVYVSIGVLLSMKVYAWELARPEAERPGGRLVLVGLCKLSSYPTSRLR